MIFKRRLIERLEKTNKGSVKIRSETRISRGMSKPKLYELRREKYSFCERLFLSMRINDSRLNGILQRAKVMLRIDLRCIECCSLELVVVVVCAAEQRRAAAAAHPSLVAGLKKKQVK